MAHIYSITNETNGKCYIGSSIVVDRRWQHHRWALDVGRHHSPHLQYAYDKYGEEQFTYEILEEVHDDRRDEREQHWIDHYRSADGSFGYNMNPTPKHVKTGHHLSEDHKRKISEALSVKMLGNKNNLGKKLSDETKAKISRAHLGKKMPEDHLQRLTAIHKGSKLTEEHKAKIGAAHRGMKRSEETCRNISNAKKGKSFNVGHPVSEETRKKIGDKHRGKFVSDETRQKQSNAQLGNRNSVGRIVSEETKRKISEAKRGTVITDEHRQRLSEAGKGRVFSEETKAKIRASFHGTIASRKLVILDNGPFTLLGDP